MQASRSGAGYERRQGSANGGGGKTAPHHLMTYMLTGFDEAETIEQVLYRFDRMVARGIKPYPMVYDPRRKDLKALQRWAMASIYRAGILFSKYNAGAKMARIKAASDMATLF
jgi:hypothetical protein